MPFSKEFKKNSIIYFDGDHKDHNAFLLKSGVCTRTRTSVETEELEVTRLNIGEFFGVKSALGRFMRDETVQIKENSVVYIFSPSEFEQVIKKNISVIFKILRAFSNELRSIHRAIESTLRGQASGTSTSENDKFKEIGDYYFSKKLYMRSLYVYKRCLEIEPNTPYKEELLKKIEDVKELAPLQESSSSTTNQEI